MCKTNCATASASPTACGTCKSATVVKVHPRVAKNGCFNRRPYKESTLVQNGYVESPGGQLTPVFESVQFRMSQNCNYTKTDLGQADGGCIGCKHREELKAVAC